MGGCNSKQQKLSDGSIFYKTSEHATFSEKFHILPSTKGDRPTPSRKINLCSWLPKEEINIKGVVLISHGLHEHAMKYYALAHALTQEGYAVYAADHYAHGKSYGTRGLIKDYKILTDNLANISNLVRNRHASNTPFFMVAHSLGTLIAIVAAEKIPDIAGVVFSGFALVPGPAAASLFGCTCLYPISRTPCAPCLTSVMANLSPMGDAAPIFPLAKTSDVANQKILAEDPFSYAGSIMNKTAYEGLLLAAAAKAAIPSFKTPFLGIFLFANSLLPPLTPHIWPPTCFACSPPTPSPTPLLYFAFLVFF